MSHLNSGIAAIGIDIGKNSFHLGDPGTYVPVEKSSTAS
jgi:hypothetical protein